MGVKAKNLRTANSGYPLLLFLVGLGLSALAGYWQHVAIDVLAKERFERMSVRSELEIASRMDKVVRALQSVRGLYAASEQVRRDEFHRFIVARNMERDFPGVRGFGFIQRVERSELSAFVAAEQRDDAPDFAIRQLENNIHADLFVLKFMEPAANNQGVPGLDIGSEPLRRAAIQQAINTGAPTVTGAIVLVQDKAKSPGLVLFVPVYQHGAPIDTPQERRAALVGLAAAPIVMAEILHGMPDVQSGMLDFEIMDAPINSSGGALLYDADDHLNRIAPGANPRAGRHSALKKPLDLPGRSVTLRMSSTPAFDKTINITFPWLLFGGGVLMSAMLASLLRLQASKQHQAEILALGMTEDLRSAQRDNEALLSTLNLHGIVSIADWAGNIIEVNDAFCAISGYSRAELLGQDHRIVNSFVQAREFWIDVWKIISIGSPWRGQVCNRAKNGSLYWVDTLIAPFFGSDGQIEKYISIRTDITAVKKAEEELRRSQSLLDKMSNASPLAFLVVDNRNDEILHFNQRFCQLWGIEHLAERMHRKELKLNDIIPDCLPVLANVAAFNESCKPLQDESNRITLEDEIAFTHQRTVRRFTTQIRDADDQYIGRFYIFEDVTLGKVAEEALQQSLKDKEALLMEVHHRVKNNLQVIASLLRMEAHRSQQADTKAVLTDMQGRIRSMALLHKVLYRSGTFASVDLGSYLQQVASQAFGAQSQSADLVRLTLRVRSVHVGMDQAISAGLLVNELISNCLKHAFPQQRAGEVSVVFEPVDAAPQAADPQWRLCVSDNGVGLPPDFDLRRKTSLGMQLVDDLGQQIGGSLMIESQPGQGAQFTLIFTALAPQSLVMPV